MSLFSPLGPKSIEDCLFAILQKGTIPLVELIRQIKILRPRTTKQGVYLVVRRLRKEEVVVVRKQEISLGGVWLSKMADFLAKAQYNTLNISSPSNDFLGLKPGEKLQYLFKNPILTDAFWSHVLLTLAGALSPQSPILIYNPHEWFLLARTENETGVFREMLKIGHSVLILAGSNTSLDKLVRRDLEGLAKFETPEAPPFPKKNYYVNVVGDFLIEARLDPKMCEAIDAFYQVHSVFGDEERAKLEAILMQKGRNKFTISHSKRKADAMRRKFKKYFFL